MPDNMTPVIYLAGPYRADNAWEIEKNIRTAERVMWEVASMDAAPLCPHSMTRFFQGTFTDEFWLTATMALMRKADAVLLFGNWQGSAGARAEKTEAERLGIPVFRYALELEAWLRWYRGFPE